MTTTTTTATENTAEGDIGIAVQLETGMYWLKAVELESVTVDGVTRQAVRSETKVAEIYVWDSGTTSLELWMFLKAHGGGAWAYSTHYRPSNSRTDKRFKFEYRALSAAVNGVVKLREAFDARVLAIKDDATENPRVEVEYSVEATCKNL